MNKYLREDLKIFKPYHSPAKPYEIKMDANETPYPHHPDFEKVMADFLKDKDHICRYPDTDSNELREAIGAEYNLDKEHVVCGVGSDQVIDMIIRAFVAPGDKVVMPTPSFGMYALSTALNHGISVEVPLTEEFEYDIDAFIDAIKREDPKVVFLCTPNNPTGCILNRETVISVIESTTCPIVVDEAYADFTGITVADLVDEYDHLIVLRTFSKAFGLAGLRTGFGIACSEMIDAINITKSPYNLSAYSQEASIFVLKHKAYYLDLVQRISEDRDQMAKDLEQLSYVEKVYESGTNFLLLKVNKPKIAQMLEKELILIRDYPPTGNLASCIRITIGTEDENRRLMTLMKSYED